MKKKESLRSEKWTLLFDGVSNSLGHGIGVILISPKKTFDSLTTILCIDFTNNATKYEACPIGIHAAIKLQHKILKIYGDSISVIHILNDNGKLNTLS